MCRPVSTEPYRDALVSHPQNAAAAPLPCAACAGTKGPLMSNFRFFVFLVALLVPLAGCNLTPDVTDDDDDGSGDGDDDDTVGSDPVTTTISSQPAVRRRSIVQSRSGRPMTGSMHFGRSRVSDPIRELVPAAIMIPFMNDPCFRVFDC